jgi:hypothetical protein
LAKWEGFGLWVLEKYLSGLLLFLKFRSFMIEGRNCFTWKWNCMPQIQQFFHSSN